MTTEPTNTRRRRGRLRRFVRWAFLLWAVGSTSWLVNTMRTRGVDDALLLDGPAVAVVDGEEMLEFRPATATSGAGLVFLCGGGVAAPAYAPLLRPIAESGHPVFIDGRHAATLRGTYEELFEGFKTLVDGYVRDKYAAA